MDQIFKTIAIKEKSGCSHLLDMKASEKIRLHWDVVMLKSTLGAWTIPYQGPTPHFDADFENFEKL